MCIQKRVLSAVDIGTMGRSHISCNENFSFRFDGLIITVLKVSTSTEYTPFFRRNVQVWANILRRIHAETEPSKRFCTQHLAAPI